MTDQPLDLDAIRARCDAATPGPWGYIRDFDLIASELEVMTDAHIAYRTAIARFEDDLDGDGAETEAEYEARIEANTAFIEAARTDVPALLDLAGRLEAELAEARAEIERLREAGAYPPPLPTTEDYRVVLRDEADADSPTGGWQLVGSTEPTLDRAVEQMATRRRHHPEWAEMRVWRRQDVWSVVAVEDRDAEPVLCVAAHPALGRICDRPGGHPGLHSGRSASGEWAQW